MWQVLFITLPTQPNAVRVRVWRRLKALGSPALRDGAYLLPQERAQDFDEVAQDIRQHGGTALSMKLAPSSAVQREEVLALFNRHEAYSAWAEQAQAFLAELPALGEGPARRHWRSLEGAVLAIQVLDFYPGPSSRQAVRVQGQLRKALDAQFSAGEPQAQAQAAIARLDPCQYQGQRWATRAKPWVDRLASAWLIGRFVDPKAQFMWLRPKRGNQAVQAPSGAIGFDFDGAQFAHVGCLVTFEVLLASFGLDGDPRLAHLARLVHDLDVGGQPVAEAAGLEAVLAGLRTQHQSDDDALLNAAATIFDALYVSAAPANKATKP